jgi:hypothetical protein
MGRIWATPIPLFVNACIGSQLPLADVGNFASVKIHGMAAFRTMSCLYPAMGSRLRSPTSFLTAVIPTNAAFLVPAQKSPLRL